MTCVAPILISPCSVARAPLLALLALAVLIAALPFYATEIAREQPNICVVIRTYWGHGGESQQGLRNLIESLQRQQNNK